MTYDHKCTPIYYNCMISGIGVVVTNVTVKNKIFCPWRTHPMATNLAPTVTIFWQYHAAASHMGNLYTFISALWMAYVICSISYLSSLEQHKRQTTPKSRCIWSFYYFMSSDSSVQRICSLPCMKNCFINTRAKHKLVNIYWRHSFPTVSDNKFAFMAIYYKDW